MRTGDPASRVQNLMDPQPGRDRRPKIDKLLFDGRPEPRPKFDVLSPPGHLMEAVNKRQRCAVAGPKVDLEGESTWIEGERRQRRRSWGSR